MTKKSLFQSSSKIYVNNFIKNEVKLIPSFQLIDESFVPKTKEIYLNFFNEVSDGEKNILTNQLRNNPKYDKIKDFDLKIKGSDTKSFELITTAFKEKREELQENKNIIGGLQQQIKGLQETIFQLNNRIEQDALNKNKKVIMFSSIVKDAKIRYEAIKFIGFANVLSSKDFIKIDTIPVVTLQWDAKLSDSTVLVKESELRNWLQKEMNLDTLFIKREK